MLSAINNTQADVCCRKIAQRSLQTKKTNIQQVFFLCSAAAAFFVKTAGSICFCLQQ
jgi:hypothetical protein